MSIPNHCFQTGKFQLLSITDSNEEWEEQCYNVIAVIDEPKRAQVNYRAMSAKFAYMTRFDHADLKEAGSDWKAQRPEYWIRRRRTNG